MPPLIAVVVYGLAILWLFRMDRDRQARTSAALWLAVAWLAIGASRNVSEWIGLGPVMRTPDQYLDGSPLDAVILAGLELAALLVLAARSRRCGALLAANGVLLVFFGYCLVSVLWSDFPLVAFKRWTKAIGNLLMVLVVLTDPDPRAAVKRVFADTGFVLIPLSIMLIKYFPELARGYDGWTGRAYNMGVGMDKNALGVICLVFGLASLWRVLTVVQTRERARATLMVHGLVLAMALWLLWLADSATSLGCFLVGSAVLVLTSRRLFARRPFVVHAFAAAIVGICLFGVVIDTELGLVQAMGRDATLTTRTALWADVLEMPVNPVVGTGFESFWLGERADFLWRKYWWRPNQAHNGYLEVLVNLGWLGIVLLGLVVGWGYRNVARALREDPEMGRLRLAFLMAAILYNLTEAAFKVMHPVWIVFILAVMATPRAPRRRALESPAADVEEPHRRSYRETKPEGEGPCRPRTPVERQPVTTFARPVRSSGARPRSVTAPSSRPPS